MFRIVAKSYKLSQVFNVKRYLSQAILLNQAWRASVRNQSTPALSQSCSRVPTFGRDGLSVYADTKHQMPHSLIEPVLDPLHPSQTFAAV